MNIIDEIKTSLKLNNYLKLLIIINISVFLIIQIINLLFFFLKTNDLTSVIQYLGLSSNIRIFIYRPWTIISYMFTHENIMHIFSNMLIFYWFGKMFISYFSQKQLLGLYLLGGIAGALLYIIVFNIMPIFSDAKYISIAIGASASIMAIVFAVASIVPDTKINILLIGEVKLKYIALIIVIIDIISIPIANAGGHIAHIGGAIMGYYFVRKYKQNKDITISVSRSLIWIANIYNILKEDLFAKKMKTNTKTEKKQEDKNQKEINKILDKIAQSGYSSLTDEEKNKLFGESKK